MSNPSTGSCAAMSRFRLGLLLADHVRPELARLHGDYPAQFAAVFDAVAGDIDWRVYDLLAGELPAAPAAADAWLITGSRHAVYEDHAWLAGLFRFIREVAAAGVPLVGICFGHQAVAHALGGRVAQAAAGWGLGHAAYRAVTDDSGLPASFTVPVCHQDQVTALPPGARTLAGSEHCAHFAVRYSDTVVGFQGHPEFLPAYLGALVESRRDALPTAVVDRACESLAAPTDAAAITRWLAAQLGLAPAAGA
ncbi:MAG: type 1 glutamine amidotransferase [Gammaproteobacteria bacterium]